MVSDNKKIEILRQKEAAEHTNILNVLLTGEKIKVKGLMLHSVGCPQPKASVFINMWNKKTFNKT